MAKSGRCKPAAENALEERFDRTGLLGFTQKEALELLLEYTGISPDKRSEKAQELLESFGSIDKMFKAKQSELEERGGLTQSDAVLFRLIPEVIKAAGLDSMKNRICPDLGTLTGIFLPCFAGAAEERFLMAGFDSRLELAGVECISAGTSCCTYAGVRRIIDILTTMNISIIAVSHNHPVGTCAPSGEDIRVTRELCRACNSLGVYMMDHLIVGTDGCYSMRAKGDINFLY